MVFDWDDFTDQDGWALGCLGYLRKIRPDFRCTLFAIPARGTPEFWAGVPDWIELAVHGWLHPTPYECVGWARDEMEFVIAHRPERFVEGFKAPGWQISDGCYAALQTAGWWVADHPMNEGRRPPGLRTHVLNVGADHWHGHINQDCGNGMEETWDHVVELVRAAPSFEFVSEAVTPWAPA